MAEEQIKSHAEQEEIIADYLETISRQQKARQAAEENLLSLQFKLTDQIKVNNEQVARVEKCEATIEY